ncbi:hypothetical protein ANO14919_130200 [Xylariales sp. No.14919]|nr:hypothetical protein ANO14919_130200 [Xylariales sp. No.14919]
MDPSGKTTGIPKTPIRWIQKPNQFAYQGGNGADHIITLPSGPIRSKQPNEMSYTDNNGVERSIYLPQGTMHTAWEHLENKRWDELAKFAPYAGQDSNEDGLDEHDKLGSSNPAAEAKGAK